MVTGSPSLFRGLTPESMLQSCLCHKALLSIHIFNASVLQTVYIYNTIYSWGILIGVHISFQTMMTNLNVCDSF